MESISKKISLYFLQKFLKYEYPAMQAEHAFYERIRVVAKKYEL